MALKLLEQHRVAHEERAVLALSGKHDQGVLGIQLGHLDTTHEAGGHRAQGRAGVRLPMEFSASVERVTLRGSFLHELPLPGLTIS